jgi:hypothetical protein
MSMSKSRIVFEGSFLIERIRSLTNAESRSSPDIPLMYSADQEVLLFDDIKDCNFEMTFNA